MAAHVESVEHVIVGAGAVGCSVAFHLALRGRRPLVLERGDVASGTTSAGFGLVWAAMKGPAHYLAFTLESLRRYPELLDQIGDRVDYVQAGGLVVLETPEKRERAWTFLEPLLGVAGFAPRLLEPDEARRLEPALGPDVAGAVFSPHEGHLTPSLLARAVARAAERHGARLALGREVRTLAREGAGWRVEAGGEAYRAERVVLCAGVWSRGLAALAGVELPVFPDKGQVLQTAPQPPLLRYPSLDARQAGDGRVWLGTIHAGDVGFDLSLSEEHSRRIRALARAQFPALAELPIERAWAGLRPMPPDGQPILGALPGAAGLYAAVGHSGISLCPLEGRLLAELLDTGRADPLLAPYAAGRFAASPG